MRLLPLLLLALSCCSSPPPQTDITPVPTITTRPFGQTPDGPATLYTFTNDGGNSVSLLDWGGIIQSIRFDGDELVLGHNDIEPYLENFGYLGATIGRYGNRIAEARFTLDGQTYELPANNNDNQLHGGPRGFDKYVWEADTSRTDDSATLTLRHVSPDGDMGFPGRLEVTVDYVWNNDNELTLRYRATTDKPTIVNLTNHAYFNIAGSGTVLDQTLRIDADRYTPVDAEMTPLGENEAVDGTPFDFRRPKKLGADMYADHPQMKHANGYDHNFALNDYDGSLRSVAMVADSATGRRMEVLTTEPGLQLWTCNFKPGQLQVRDGEDAPVHAALCLETQHFPDSPNQDNFTTPRLDPDQTYATTTVYRFLD